MNASYLYTVEFLINAAWHLSILSEEFFTNMVSLNQLEILHFIENNS